MAPCNFCTLRYHLIIVGKKYPPWGGGLCAVAVDGFADFVQ